MVTLSISIPSNMDAVISFDPLIKKGQCVKLMNDNEIIWMRGEMNDRLKLLTDVRGISDLSEDEFTGTMSIRVTSGEYAFVAYWQ
jgi:hypothetical protein